MEAHQLLKHYRAFETGSFESNSLLLKVRVNGAYLWDVDDLDELRSRTSHSNRKANGADRCTHTSNQYDASPSVRYHEPGGFTSGEINPVDVDVE